MAEIRCFWTEDTGRVRLSLRRFRFVHGETAKCSGPMGYHDASVDIGDAPAERSERGYLSELSVKPYQGDSRWPARCSCGYEFQPDDRWQVNQDAIHRSAERGEEWPFRRLPPGAMFDAFWFRDDSDAKKSVDGISLGVCLPPGLGDYWIVDGPSSNGNGWTRTGPVPNVTATPSIQTRLYHGWLRNGVLVEC